VHREGRIDVCICRCNKWGIVKKPAEFGVNTSEKSAWWFLKTRDVTPLFCVQYFVYEDVQT